MVVWQRDPIVATRIISEIGLFLETRSVGEMGKCVSYPPTQRGEASKTKDEYGVFFV